MSIYNTSTTNDIDIKTRQATIDTLYVKNLLGTYERVLPGGGGGGGGGDGGDVELPYYLNPSDIDLGGVVINSDGIILGDNDGNETLTAGNIREDRAMLSAIETTINQHANEIQDLDQLTTANLNSIQSLQTTVGSHVTDISTLKSRTFNLSYNPTSGNTSIANPTKVCYATLEDGLRISATPGLTNTNPYVNIKNSMISIYDPSKNNSVFMNYNRIDNLAKLESICTTTFNDKIDFTKKVGLSGVPTTDTANKKMVVLDSTTKELSMTDIPSMGSNYADPLEFWDADIDYITPNLNTSTPQALSSWSKSGEAGREVPNVYLTEGQSVFIRIRNLKKNRIYIFKLNNNATNTPPVVETNAHIYNGATTMTLAAMTGMGSHSSANILIGTNERYIALTYNVSASNLYPNIQLDSDMDIVFKIKYIAPSFDAL